MTTGENEQGLRRILDMTRMIGILVLTLHFYFYCYQFFVHWNIRSAITDRLLRQIYRTGLFDHVNRSRLLSLLFLLISLAGSNGRKDRCETLRKALALAGSGLLVYFFAGYLVYLLPSPAFAIAYMSVTFTGYILVLSGGSRISRIIREKLDAGDRDREDSFLQEERQIPNDYSINLPARYRYKGAVRKSWINIINPFRGVLIMGSPGSGKSYFIVQHVIRQHLRKGFSMFVYDFKFDDLSRIAYNHYLLNRGRFAVTPRFFVINFDDLSRSHRCNPLEAATLRDISDAAESSRTIMLGLNRDWIRKQGDFFVESPINFVTALIWFLCRYQGGKYCTLPHVIELAQVEYDKLFSILRAEPQIEVLINPFVSAYLNGAREQLEGQVASAKIGLSRLSAPSLYYILTGGDFSLDINNPLEPKIVCMGSNPQKMLTYGAVLSLYVTTLTRLINKRNGTKSCLLFDEFPTIYFNGIDHLMATARSNRVATIMSVQDVSQLKLHYGRDQAEVIINIAGNVISGQVSGETARQLSEKFGRIMQGHQSISTNSSDTSITHSLYPEPALPVSRISSLSSGEFVGVVADDPGQKIRLKAFCAEIVNDHERLAREEQTYEELPMVSPVSPAAVTENYHRVKKEVQEIVLSELERIMDTPELEDRIIRKR